MARPRTNGPTNKELAILTILWDQGPCTVRQVHEILASQQKTAYTTTLKLMQIMAEKDLVLRDSSQRTHIYRAVPQKDAVQKQMLGHLLDHAFAGSTAKLVMHALSAQPVSPEELEDIKQYISTYENHHDTA